jgi:hypothetical protein
MATGDVEVRVVSATTTDVDTALTAMRVTAGANGKYGMVSINNGQSVLIWAITEA